MSEVHTLIRESERPQDLGRPSKLARFLGYVGLIPFVVLAALTCTPQLDYWRLSSFALLGYGAVIASFLGAIHWGLAMRQGSAQSALSLSWGVVPSLFAWLALLLDRAPGLSVVAVLLWGCFAADVAMYPRYELRAWLRLRLELTVVSSISCIVAAAALLR